MTNCLLLSEGGIALKVAHEEASGFKLVYFGPASGEMGVGAVAAPVLPAGPDAPPGARLLAQRGDGYDGASLIEAAGTADGRAAALKAVSMQQTSSQSLRLHAADAVLGLQVEVEIRLAHGLAHFRTRVRNSGTQPVLLIRCAALQLPLMDWARETVSGFGAWAREGHESRRALDGGFGGKASRLGRSGFDGPPGITVCESGTTQTLGRALSVQLAWSGSHRIQAERLRDGAAELIAEALYEPGEILLAPGSVFETPEALVAISAAGFGGLGAIWHAHARRQVRPVARPVHFNTWEARYFDFDEASLIELAGQAAQLGIERFVLDDGWFLGRRNDTTSLGDWTPDPDRFPNGLAPLIGAVRKLGLSFGLWVEPEMISRDSQLYRAHPDWALGYPDEMAPTGRNQLVLDLSNPEVRNFLFESLARVLRPGGIDYLKWDCNRELYPASHSGKMRATAQVQGLYDLLDRLQAEFPALEIESCASGGGRIDFGILPRVMRFWASDATDAEDRIRIQDSLSRYLPMELMGSHVGPSPNPITGRAFPMAFRGMVAMFGHLGVELDPARLRAEDHAVLVEVIALHKRIRSIVHGGTYAVLDTADPALHVSTLTRPDTGEFLLRTLRTEMSAYPLQARTAIPGLPPLARYEVRELRPGDEGSLDLGVQSAEALAWTGVQADPRKPHLGRLFHFIPLR